MDSKAQRSRRSVLVGAAAGAAALVAERLAQPSGAQAVSAAVMTETLNTAGASTSLYCSSGSAFGALAQNSGSGLWGATNDSATGSAGVYGLAYVAGGTGVLGVAQNAGGTGVLAKNNHADGTALRVSGKARFTRSGRAKVLAGNTAVDVSVPGGLSGTPLLFANLQRHRSGIAVAAVRPNYPSAGKARIYLTKAVPSDTYVAWFVVA